MYAVLCRIFWTVFAVFLLGSCWFLVLSIGFHFDGDEHRLKWSLAGLCLSLFGAWIASGLADMSEAQV